MKGIPPLFALLLFPAVAGAYDIDQLLNDLQRDPARIYRNLHPEAKAYVDSGIERYRASEDFREEKFIEFDKSPESMKPAEIWTAIWNDYGYGDFYQDGYAIIHSFDNGEYRYVVVQEHGYPDEVKMIDTFVFRKSGDGFLFYPPGWIMDYYTPVETLVSPDGVVDEAALEAFIKSRIEENMTAEDAEAFKNATSPADVSELMKKIMEGESAE